MASSATTLLTQTIPTGKICGIYFDYDAAGNRIRQMYDCRAPFDSDGPETPSSQTISSDSTGGIVIPHRLAPSSPAVQSSTITVFPNPTAGRYTIQRSKAPEKPLHFHWYTLQKQIISSGIINQEIFSGTIENWPDGVYLLCVYEASGRQVFRVVKTAAVKGN